RLPKSPPHSRRRAVRNLVRPTDLAILRRPRSRQLTGMRWREPWGLKFRPSPSRPRRARTLWRDCLAFPHRLREPESKRKKNAANAASSAQHIRTRRKNELRGKPPAIMANPSKDMSGQFAKLATSLILLSLAIDSNLAVQEATKDIANASR